MTEQELFYLREKRLLYEAAARLCRGRLHKYLMQVAKRCRHSYRSRRKGAGG